MGITSARGAAVRWFGHPAALRSGTSAYSVGVLLHVLSFRTPPARHRGRQQPWQQFRQRLREPEPGRQRFSAAALQRPGISSEACDPVAREAAVVGGKLVSKPV